MSKPLSARQRRVLAVLADYVCANPVIIARATSLSTGFVRMNMVPLVEYGYAIRNRGLYEITDAGRAALAASVSP